jgi:hypothetical protein
VAEVIKVQTTIHDKKMVTVIYEQISPWLSSVWRVLEQALYIGIAAAVDFSISYVSTGQGKIDPLYTGLIVAALTGIAKFVKEKAKAKAVTKVEQLDS